MRNFTLTQLITPDVLQKIQDAFSDFTGMAALTTDAAGVPVTEGSNFLHFCTNVVRGSAEGCRQCKKCDKDGALMTMNTQKTAIYRCHAGLVDFAAPIVVNGHFIGSFVGGQVLTDELDEELCRKKALEYGIDPKVYIEAARKAPRMTKEQVEKSAKLLFDITKALSVLALHNFTEIEKSRSLELAARSQSDYIMSVFSEVATLGDDCVQSARDALETDDHEKMRETLSIMARNGSGPTARIRDSITYIKSIGKKFRMIDEEYNPHRAITAAFFNIKNRAPDAVSLELDISGEVPGLMLGDAGNMCQLLDKLISIGVEAKCSRIAVSVTSSKRCYAEVLHIVIRAEGFFISAEMVNTVNCVLSGHDEYIPTTQDDLDLSVIRSLLATMSGRICVTSTDFGSECRIDLPQLKLEGDNA